MLLPLIGAGLTTGLGLMGLLFPKAAAAFTSIQPDGKVGLSEIRATYGGFFLSLGSYCLWQRSPVAFRMLGLAWLAAAAARLFSLLIDQSRSPKNLGGIAFEAAIGALLLL